MHMAPSLPMEASVVAFLFCSLSSVAETNRALAGREKAGKKKSTSVDDMKQDHKMDVSRSVDVESSFRDLYTAWCLSVPY